MRKLLSLIAVLSLPVFAHADATPPPFTYISREVVLEFAEEYPGWTFFAVAGFDRRVARVNTAGPVALSALVGNDYYTRRMGVRVCAIPDDVLAEIGAPTTDSKWYERHGKDRRVMWLNIGPMSISTTMADPRARVIETYRVTMTPTELEMELVSENAEYGSGVCVGGAWVLVVVGLVWLVVWLIRRMLHRPVTRTAPPPGT